MGLRKLAQLIEVRKIIALIIVCLFCVLSYLRILQVDFVQSVIVTVITFYFAKSTALDKPNKTDAEYEAEQQIMYKQQQPIAVTIKNPLDTTKNYE